MNDGGSCRGVVGKAQPGDSQRSRSGGGDGDTTVTGRGPHEDRGRRRPIGTKLPRVADQHGRIIGRGGSDLEPRETPAVLGWPILAIERAGNQPPRVGRIGDGRRHPNSGSHRTRAAIRGPDRHLPAGLGVGPGKIYLEVGMLGNRGAVSQDDFDNQRRDVSGLVAPAHGSVGSGCAASGSSSRSPSGHSIRLTSTTGFDGSAGALKVRN